LDGEDIILLKQLVPLTLVSARHSAHTAANYKIPVEDDDRPPAHSHFSFFSLHLL
jgi:hypothetical protein